ncbi:hypothetical protein BT63DRAFT_445999 [Microthyrium microscopicum]|uniref:Ferric oxidoreductase domain-containing protein n=1 Tax=Microthyrium microscopicum TaxID=703497 RepID=A0A6A6UKY6_9PEZI|nr:hypothetical protein BT63DRAFT_445999 [Microthyrium microscopicum]
MFIATIAQLFLVASVTARSAHFQGLIGFPHDLNELSCATDCFDTIAFNPLSCTPTPRGPPKGRREPITPPKCFASNPPFLSTLAWCVKTKCSGEEVWKIEKWWHQHAATPKIFPTPPVPKLTYQESLASIKEPPTKVLASENILINQTMLFNNQKYVLNVHTSASHEEMGQASSKAAISIAVLSLGFPVILTFLWYFFPIPKPVLSKIYGTFIYPAMIRNKRRVPLPFSIGYAPTYGEGIYIVIIIFANVLAAGIGFKSFSPSTNYPQPSGWEIAVYFGNRCGMLALVNFMILALFAGRNNILLRITNWPHATYLLLHRWIAYCCIMEAVLHSIVWVSRATLSTHNHSQRVRATYWQWGIVGTLSFSLIFMTSILPIRQRMYELFLAGHVILAAAALLAVWQHIWYKYTRDLGSHGYEIFIYFTLAFWVLDHVMRVLRIAKNGIGKAEITIVDDDYIQIDVRNIEVEGHVYLYFPTLSWRVWENHPFSVYASALPDQSKSPNPNSPRESEKSSFSEDIEKRPGGLQIETVTQTIQPGTLIPGFSLLVRGMGGTTRHLRNRKSLVVLVEGSYHCPKPPPPHCRLIAIAGGVGITAVLPTLRHHLGPKKLYWGCRTPALVDQVSPHLANIDKKLSVSQRLDLPAVLFQELQGPGVDVVVMVCGPSEMADEVRGIVSAYVRKGERHIILEDESFGW